MKNEKILKIREHLNTMQDDSVIEAWNFYATEQDPDGQIFNNDEDFFGTYFENNPFEAVRACFFGDFKFADDYICLNGYANLDTFSFISDKNCPVDIDLLAEYIFENQSAFEHLIDFESLEICED